VALATVAGVVSNDYGFGSTDLGVSLLGLLPAVFMVAPRSGTITMLNVSVRVTVAVSLLASTITFQVYRAPANSSTFTLLAGVAAPVAIDLVTVGTTIAGTSGPVSVPVAAGDQLALVSTSDGLVTAVTGVVGAGLAIS